MLYEHIGKDQSKIPTCKLHEDGIRVTKIEIQDRDGRGMPYRQGSSNHRDERKTCTLMVQTKEHNHNKHTGYIMSEDLGNIEEA
eukprot:12322422-Heterocapsa_arctica.AAC.1